MYSVWSSEKDTCVEVVYWNKLQEEEADKRPEQWAYEPHRELAESGTLRCDADGDWDLDYTDLCHVYGC